VNVRNIALLEDQTVLVEFTTTTSQAGATGKPDVKSYALTLRYQIVAPTADAALTANPFGIFIPFFRIERTGGA
jgi:type IV secretion system protein VirB5